MTQHISIKPHQFEKEDHIASNPVFPFEKPEVAKWLDPNWRSGGSSEISTQDTTACSRVVSVGEASPVKLPTDLLSWTDPMIDKQQDASSVSFHNTATSYSTEEDIMRNLLCHRDTQTREEEHHGIHSNFLESILGSYQALPIAPDSQGSLQPSEEESHHLVAVQTEPGPPVTDAALDEQHPIPQDSKEGSAKEVPKDEQHPIPQDSKEGSAKEVPKDVQHQYSDEPIMSYVEKMASIGDVEDDHHAFEDIECLYDTDETSFEESHVLVSFSDIVDDYPWYVHCRP